MNLCCRKPRLLRKIALQPVFKTFLVSDPISQPLSEVGDEHRGGNRLTGRAVTPFTHPKHFSFGFPDKQAKQI